MSYHRHTYEIITIAEAVNYGFRFRYCPICKIVPTQLVGRAHDDEYWKERERADFEDQGD